MKKRIKITNGFSDLVAGSFKEKEKMRREGKE